jgi:hypothetical protein
MNILVAHGTLDTLGAAEEPSALRQEALEAAITDGRFAYAALGGRPATMRVGDTGRIWYAGTPQPIDFDGGDVGNVLVVSLDGDRCDVTRRAVGTWRLRTEAIELDTGLGATALRARLDMVPAKERTVIRLALKGRISLTEHARVQRIIAEARHTFASIEEPVASIDLTIRPTDDDFAGLGLAGFATATVARLRSMTAGTGAEADRARDALAMLIRLADTDGATA